MTTTSDGFLSIEQLDRVNLKTMAQGGLPAPYGQGDIFGALKAIAHLYLEEGPVELTDAEALQIAVDWYCTSTTESVVVTFERLADNPIYQNTKILVDTRHTDPQLYERMVKDLSRGWQPGDPKSTD